MLNIAMFIKRKLAYIGVNCDKCKIGLLKVKAVSLVLFKALSISLVQDILIIKIKYPIN